MQKDDKSLEPCIRPEKEARIIRAFGDEMILHLSSNDTGGKFTQWTNVTPPGGGPPPHFHKYEDECFLPLSGPAEFLKNGAWIKVQPKTAVFMPKNEIHSFRNPNSEPLHMLIQTMPGGFEEFFAKCAKEFDTNKSPDMRQIIEISAEFGIHYVD